MNKLCLSIFLAILMALLAFPQALSREAPFQPPHWIVWNVGQGLWVTRVGEECLHFDAGGEKAPWASIQRACAGRSNYFSFSHWDEDHISFARQAAHRLDSCLWHAPGGTGSLRKQHLMSALPICEFTQNLDVEELTRPSARPIAGRKILRKPHSNDLSRVYLLHRVLLPGDATRAEERTWVSRDLKAIQFLVLGHHGSRTSTSRELIAKLPRLREAIASARFARYGHPHAEVLARLRARGVAVLSTEDWGSISWADTPREASETRGTKGREEN